MARVGGRGLGRAEAAAAVVVVHRVVVHLVDKVVVVDVLHCFVSEEGGESERARGGGTVRRTDPDVLREPAEPVLEFFGFLELCHASLEDFVSRDFETGDTTGLAADSTERKLAALRGCLQSNLCLKIIGRACFQSCVFCLGIPHVSASPRRRIVR